ncbi:MAG: hypothetical protein NZ750_02440 [Anaerolineae bacterium]|nr:hypothetical protein [Anaerolineae bacterium]MDW8173462.1 hypothetical protein [Anaerolineae bacterium]
MPSRWGRWAFAAAFALVGLALLADLWPILRGGEALGWQWATRAPQARLSLLLLALLIYLIGSGPAQRRDSWSLAWASLGTGGLSLALVAVWHEWPLVELFHRAISPTATGPMAVAAWADWSDPRYAVWSQAMPTLHDFSRHVALSPPLLPWLMRAAQGALALWPGLSAALQAPLLDDQCASTLFLSYTPAERASAWVGVIMPLWAGLAVVPLWAIARRWYGSDWARTLALAYPLIPALALFAGSWNTAYPLGALLTLWAFLRGASSEGSGPRPAWLIFSGLIYGLLTFANFSLVPLALVLGWLALWPTSDPLPKGEVSATLAHQREGSTVFYYFYHQMKAALLVGLWFGLGALLPWAVYSSTTGDSPLAVLTAAFDQHFDLAYESPLWAVMHLWEWAVMGGLPIMALAMLSLKPSPQAHPQATRLAWALLLSLLILVMTHVARGETGRVWLFFAPLALLCLPPQPLGGWPLRTALACVMVGLSGWLTMSADDVRPRPAPPQLTEAAWRPIDADFGPFRLLAWTGEGRTGGIVLRLLWQADERMALPYWLAGLPVGPESNLSRALVWQPDATRYPTTCWRVGESWAEQVTIPLPERAPAGAWYVSLTAFAHLDDPMNTLTVSLPDGSTDRQVGLGPLLKE